MINEPVKLLITGAEGQTGYALATLAKLDPFFSVIALNHKQMDVAQSSKVFSVLDAHLPDYLVNCAALNCADTAELNPEEALLLNATAAKTLAEGCGDLSIPLIQLSSDYVFDGHYASGYSELDVPNPLGVYGKTLLQGEEYVRQYQPRHIILRSSWLFGDRGDNYLMRMLEEARSKQIICAEDDRRGSPTSAYDLARVVLAMLKQIHCGIDVWGTYHYCGAEITTRYGFCEAIVATARQFEALAVERIDAVSSLQRDLPIHPSSAVLKCNKILHTFGIRQRPWRQEMLKLVKSINHTIHIE